MPNRRTEIRTAFVDFLKGKIPLIPNVYAAHRRPLEDEELPAIIVSLGEESSSIFNASPRQYERELEVVIEIYLRSKNNIEEDLELVMRMVEYAINREDRFSLYQSVAEIIYTGATVSPDGREATQESGVATLRYKVVYYTWAGKYADDLPELESLFADWDGLASDHVIIDQV